MIDLEFTAFLLDGTTAYGPLSLVLVLVAGSVGLPIPAGLVVLAAGASVRLGVVEWGPVLLLCLSSVVLGDSSSYALGRFGGRWVQRVFGRRRASTLQAAQERFRRQGAWAVFLTRFLLTPLDVPTNLIAGGSRYAFRRFLACAAVGRLAWIAVYGGLGYASGSQWEVMAGTLGEYGGWLAAAAAIGGALFLVVRRLQRSRPICVP
jgi:membrane protein DedA with SNARE-associated domain